MLLSLMRKSLLLAGALGGILFVPFYLRAAAVQPEAQRSEAWRALATEQDRQRIRNWRRSWMEGLGAARRGHEAEIAQAGALLDPDAALLDPGPPPGAYRCRTIKLGGSGLSYVAYPEFSCRIAREGQLLHFDKLSGSQRPRGHIYADGSRRMIFLGSLQLGDERQVLPYGSDPRRDMAGILERIGDRRWRLVLPQPAFESAIDVMELTPAS
jgi:hypothetical protein